MESKREAVTTGRPSAFESVIPDELEAAIARRVRQAVDEEVARRLWRKDESLWGGPGVPEIGDRLGWLTIVDAMLEEAGDLEAFAASCRSDGFTDAVLLGMGGSSLAPEVIRRSYGELEGGLRLHVLDSTDPAAVLAVERAVDLEQTLFVVSSKSAGTLETVSHFRYFHAKVSAAVGPGPARRHFVAITDPGSRLAELGQQHGFRHVFLNDPDIGGRYAALSYVGMVPAALMGVDVRGMLERAQVAEQACANYDHSSSNAGLWLGVAIGELARQGRDKVTFAIAEPIGSFGLWIEQLVAESTGKQGTGILPVVGEPLGAPDVYGDDRVFVHLRSADAADEGFAPGIAALAQAGHPALTLDLHGADDLGRLFFFAEFAVAVAGWVLEINPFDQPNVQEAKDSTRAVLDGYAQAGELPPASDAGEAELRRLLAGVAPPHYVAVMGYLQPSEDFDEAVVGLRETIRARTGAATTFGYGPRFLHSTGQLHKGGKPTGVFLQLVHDGPEDAEIPEAGYTFGTLKNAQAVGDLRTLRAHELPAERFRLEGDPVAALRDLTAMIEEL